MHHAVDIVAGGGPLPGVVADGAVVEAAVAEVALVDLAAAVLVAVGLAVNGSFILNHKQKIILTG
jgi:hypothetical protein